MSSTSPKLVSFNLDTERVPCTNTPMAGGGPGRRHLAEVHGRLGLAVSRCNRSDVWVLEEKGRRWILGYTGSGIVSRSHTSHVPANASL